MRRSFWVDTLPEREPHAPLDEVLGADLCIVGGGYTGLWAALYAKELDPARDVVLLEATRCGAGASGRNGGFLQSSLTHGVGNGLARFGDELAQLERLGLGNFRALADDSEPARGSTPSSRRSAISSSRSSRASWKTSKRRRRCSQGSGTRPTFSTPRESGPR